MTYFTIAGPVHHETKRAVDATKGFGLERDAPADAADVMIAVQLLAKAINTIAETVDKLGQEIARLR